MRDQSLVLIADDDPSGRQLLKVILSSRNFALSFASSGAEALQLATELQPDLLLLDVIMPGPDGIEVCRQLRADARTRDMPIVLLTGIDDTVTRLRGIEAGADDFVTKPYDLAELRARVETITRLNRYRRLIDENARLEAAHHELQQAYDATIDGWVRALDLRDSATEGHSQRVAQLTVTLAMEWGIAEPELPHVRRGALLHDIGKIGIPDGILRKPGPLNEQELAVMRLHPEYAHEMLAPIAYLQSAIDIPWCHHEHWDGSGYPRGIAGEEIPVAARLFAVVDVWDALRSDRPYRSAWPVERVRDYIADMAGAHFDPRAVGMFLDIAGSFD